MATTKLAVVINGETNRPAAAYGQRNPRTMPPRWVGGADVCLVLMDFQTIVAQISGLVEAPVDAITDMRGVSGP